MTQNRRYEYFRARQEKLKHDLLTHYSSGKMVCACPGCGVSEERFLTLDHIIPRAITKLDKRGNGRETYERLRREGMPSGMQVLCHNCNQAKRALPVCPVHAV